MIFQLARRVATSAASRAVVASRTTRSFVATTTLPRATVSSSFKYSFSTKAAIDPRRDAQQEIWKQFLQTKQGASELFDDLDLNYNGKISVKEIEYFIKSVNREGVRDEAFDLLMKLGQQDNQKELNETEFRQWLAMAVEFDESAEKSTAKAQLKRGEQAVVAVNQSVGDNGAVSAVQVAIWDTYLSGENPIQSSIDLYRTIDLDHNGTISVEEITTFLNSINSRSIDPDEVEELMQAGSDHELTEGEFSIWLAGAVNVDGDHLRDDHSSRHDGDGCAPQL